MGDESFVLIVYSIDFVALLFPYSLPQGAIIDCNQTTS